jgi:Transthyretin-like family
MRAIGTVVEEDSGRPIAGLHVRAFDKDLLFDDKLGVAVTDAKGAFRIDYTELDFSSIFGNETTPELYIRIYDVTDKKLLYTSEKSIRKNVQVEERFDVKIPRSKLV